MASLSPARSSLPRLYTNLPGAWRPGVARRPHRPAGAVAHLLRPRPPGHLAGQDTRPVARLLRPDRQPGRLARPSTLGRRAVRTGRRGVAGAVAPFARGARRRDRLAHQWPDRLGLVLSRSPTGRFP